MNWKSKLAVSIIVAVVVFIMLSNLSHLPSSRIHETIVILIGVGLSTYLFLGIASAIATKRKRLGTPFEK